MPLVDTKKLSQFLQAKPSMIRGPLSQLPAVAGQQRMAPAPTAPAVPQPDWVPGRLPPMMPRLPAVAGQQRVAALRDLGQQLFQLEHFLRTCVDQLSDLRTRVHALELPEAAPAVPAPQPDPYTAMFGNRTAADLIAERNALRMPVRSPASDFFGNKTAADMIAKRGLGR